LVAKSRGIAIPSDLETQVASLFNKAAMLSRQTSKWLQAAKTPKMERSQSQVGYVIDWERRLKKTALTGQWNEQMHIDIWKYLILQT